MLALVLTDVALVTTGAGALIVSVKVAFPVPPLFVALSVTLEAPVAVGVPEISPLVVLMLNPSGNPAAP
jgi:hypothetical protein